MKKKTTFLCLLLLILSVFTLTGCHGSKSLSAFSMPETFDETKHYDITFWAKNDTNKTQTDIYNNAIKNFEKLYPNITVNLKLYTDYGKIYNDVITNISTRTTPNVCITYPDHIATYMTGANTVVPLEDIFDDPSYGFGGTSLKYDAPKKDEVIPEFLEEGKLGDHYYAIPYMRSTEAVYVNKTYVEKLGYTLPETLTWDFIWEVSEKAMEKDSQDNYKVNGQKVLIPFIYKSTDNFMIQYLYQKNAPYSDENGNIQIFNDTTTEFLKEIAVHAKSGAFSTFKISSYPANFLNAGQCIFACDSTAGSTWMGSHAPLIDISADKLVDFETKVYSVPQVDPEHPLMISQGPSICIFNKEDSDEVLASWLFAQYMLSNDVQIAYSKTEGYVPVTTKARETKEYIDYLSSRDELSKEGYSVKIDATRLLLENTENTFVTPVFNGSASLRDASGQLIESVTKSVRRQETIDDAYFEKLYNDTSSLYHLDKGKGLNSENGKEDLGPLPKTSKTLLWILISVWILIGAYAGYTKFFRK